LLKRRAPLLRRAHRGQKGITLIELLIVIAILGVIAGVIIYAVGPFRGAGTLQSANTESAAVRTAVQAYLAEGGTDTGNGTMGSNVGPSRNCTGFATNLYGRTPIDYFDGTLKALYNINTTAPCIITSTDPTGTGNWGSSIKWDSPTCSWIKS
jgi:prepilin-type N-terminal cleavage/methylation domain-containing protein